MAGPISHIIYAQKYFEKHPSALNKDEFILGSVFPDIRRISKNIKREDTHIPVKDHVDLKIIGGTNSVNLDFTDLSSFQAGWKFHLYCDMKREEILKKQNFYSLEMTTDYWAIPSKILEEMLIYTGYNNWEKIYHYFNHAPQIETGLNVPRETLALWYSILAKYIEQPPTLKSAHIFLTKQFFLKDKADKIIAVLAKIQENRQITTILKSLPEKILD
jgi:hypothetical protein